MKQKMISFNDIGKVDDKVRHMIFTKYEVELSCGHTGEILSTGYLGDGYLDCKLCDQVEEKV